jgi:hypothetical protein
MPPEVIAKKIQDALASSEKVREGLADAEALPFMDWGIAYAEVLGARLAAPGKPELNEEQIGEVAYGLTRLMTRLTWLVTYRDKKDADWLTQTFQMVNKLSGELLGEGAPVFSDAEIAAWLAEHSQRTNGELLQAFMVRFAPPEMASAAPEPGSEPGPEPGPEPEVSEVPVDTSPSESAAIPPLSNFVFGAKLPGRSEPDNDTKSPPRRGATDD